MDGERADCHLQDPRVVNKKSYSTIYTLPTLRYANVVKTIVFIDGISSLVLWLTGGLSQYFIDNIVHFHFLESVFDLALLAAVKTILLFTLLGFLENASMGQIGRPYDQSLSTKKNTLHAIYIIFLLLCMAFTITKGGLILNALLNDPMYPGMHLTFNILTISSAVFSIIEFLLALASFAFMRRLKLCRIKHMYNDDGHEVDEEGKVIKKGTSLRRLATLAKEELLLLVSGCICLVASSGTTMVAPLLFGQVVDAAQKSMADLNKSVLILLGVYAGGTIFSMGRSWTFTIAGQRVVASLRQRLFAKVIIQDIAFFDVTRTGELTNRLSSDTGVIQNAVTVNISMLLRNILQVLGSIVLMFVINPALTGVLLAVVPVVSVGAVQYGMFVKKKQQKFQDRLAEASTVAEECISSARTVRMFSSERASIKAYDEKVQLSYQVGKILAIAGGAFEGVIGLAAYGAIVLVLWYGGKLVFEQVITAGVLFSFMLYTLQVSIAFGTLSSLYGDFMKAVGASVRIFDLLDRVPEVPCQGGDKPIDFDGSISFHNVRFTYPSRPDTEVLKDVSFSVQPGQMVALVGPSGGGKSTIVSLIERFYDPTAGSVDVGSYNLKSLDPEWLHAKVSMVGQEPVLFASSIKDNIAYGREASLEEVIEASKQANAHDFILSFDEGYDTLVGERGVRLSGGQKQRVAIARALIMNPDVLLLDEATSALDAESEHLVQEAIDNAMNNRTVLVIAHRLSTVKHASKVLVIDKGQVAEQGTHDELLELDGVYKKLVLRQLMAGKGSDTKEGDSSLEQSEEVAKSEEGVTVPDVD